MTWQRGWIRRTSQREGASPKQSRQVLRLPTSKSSAANPFIYSVLERARAEQPSQATRTRLKSLSAYHIHGKHRVGEKTFAPETEGAR
jgi:hypothetical protein